MKIKVPVSKALAHSGMQTLLLLKITFTESLVTPGVLHVDVLVSIKVESSVGSVLCWFYVAG